MACMQVKKTLFDMPSESGVKNSLLPGVSKKTHEFILNKKNSQNSWNYSTGTQLSKECINKKKMSNLGFAKLVAGFDVSEIALQVMHTFLLSFKDQYVKCVYFKYVHQIGLKYANWRMTNLSLLQTFHDKHVARHTKSASNVSSFAFSKKNNIQVI